MLKKTLVSLGLSMLLGAPAFSDTHISEPSLLTAPTAISMRVAIFEVPKDLSPEQLAGLSAPVVAKTLNSVFGAQQYSLVAVFDFAGVSGQKATFTNLSQELSGNRVMSSKGVKGDYVFSKTPGSKGVVSSSIRLQQDSTDNKAQISTKRVSNTSQVEGGKVQAFGWEHSGKHYLFVGMLTDN